ncbi:MAG: ECF transporter S component [Oscillospiraceae bacterium]|nr:ECF transporter S component [Oscillospiraceae bacterium]
MSYKPAKKLVLSALFLALCYVLPFFTGNIPQIGAMLLPMHLPVILCGFLCGGTWGGVVGAVAPVMRSVLTGGFPPMFPTAFAMSFELAAYGLMCGLLFRRLPRRPIYIYLSLIVTMIFGRVVWGVVMALITLNGSGFTVGAFVAGAFTNAIAGILLQLVAIPPVVYAVGKLKNRPVEV